MMGLRRGCWVLILLVSGTLAAGLGGTALGDPAQGLMQGEGTIVIHSQTLEADDVSRRVTFTGQVDAQRGDLGINCEKMVVYYLEAGSKGAEGGASRRIERIVASGNVKITRGEGGTARSDEAVYYESEEKIVLTGHPVLTQGNDVVEGDRVTFFLKDNRSIVESSDSKRVKAVIHPRAGGK